LATELSLFDYAALDPETRIVVQQRTGEIKDRVRRSQQDMIEIGERLIEVKGRLAHGHFGKWLETEFAWTDQTARNLMNVAEAFKSKTVLDLPIDRKALYALAAPSVPEAAREEAKALATNGHHVTHAEAKQIVEKHKGIVSTDTLPPGQCLFISDPEEQTEVESGEPEPDEEEEDEGGEESDDDSDEPLTLESASDSSADAERQARRWKSLLTRLVNEIGLVVNGICDESSPGLMTAAPKWFVKDIKAVEAHFDLLRDAAVQGKRKFREFRKWRDRT
jgi:hypothetical protein